MARDEILIGDDFQRHELVPKHEICSKEEVEEILKKYNAKLEQLPKILETDPVVKALGAKVGDVVKITRKSRTAGKFIAYRVVVPARPTVRIEEEEEVEEEKEEEETTL